VQRQRDRAVVLQMYDRGDCRGAMHPLGKKQQKIDGPGKMPGQGGFHANRPCARIIGQHDPLAADRVQPKRIDIDHRYPSAGFRHSRSEQATHRPCPHDRNRDLHQPLGPLVREQ